MMNDKLKDSIITQEDIDVEVKTDDERVSDNTYYPIEKKRIYIEMAKPSMNAQLYNIEQIIDASLAILMKRKEEGELSKVDWKRLTDLVDMKLKLSKLEYTNKQTSILEGKSNREILELVEMAKETLENENE